MNNDYETAKELMKKRVWAVVGANNNPDKYGNIIYKRLKAAGYTVYPVNPLYESVEGDTCYPNLTALPEIPDVIDMVVTPKRGYAIVDEAHKLGIQHFWFQPGTHDEDLVAHTEAKEMTALQGCVLVALSGS